MSKLLLCCFRCLGPKSEQYNIIYEDDNGDTVIVNKYRVIGLTLLEAKFDQLIGDWQSPYKVLHRRQQ